MLKLVEQIEQKFDEYDIRIYQKNQVDENEYNIIAEDMILAVKGSDTIGVSFQVTTKPEVVGAHIGILNEVENLVYLNIMDSFAYTSEKQLISGDEAYKLLNETIEHNMMKKLKKEDYYKKILLVAEGYNC